MQARDYLKKAYARRLTPDEDGGYVGTIQEFPGLVAQGETADETMANLESAAESWLEAALESGQPIPEPVILDGYSGKVALRLPRGLHKQVSEMASSEGTSINQWLISAIAFVLGRRQAIKSIEGQVALQAAQQNVGRILGAPASGCTATHFFMNLNHFVIVTTGSGFRSFPHTAQTGLVADYLKPENLHGRSNAVRIHAP